MAFTLPQDMAELHNALCNELFEHIMPFWPRHAVDAAGGLNTCISDSGEVLNRDKWLWSQWRAVWVFSKLYNDFGNEQKWLDLATHIYSFAIKNGWGDGIQGWRLCLAFDGSEIRGYESVYVDGFAIYGLTQYARATGDPQAVAMARCTADAVIEKLARPHHALPSFPYPIPTNTRAQGIPMIFSLVLWELGQLLNEDRYRDAGVAQAREILQAFYRPERGLVVERVATDGNELPAPLGTTIVPGHIIESMWFQIHIARDRGDEATIHQACELIKRNLEFGWDEEFGGIYLARDADGGDEVGWGFADTKVWWPQTEALYATLLAHQITGEPWCLQWFTRVYDYCMAHYPVRQHGEWTQRLDRKGELINDVVALPVKDPFHLPRALIYCIQATKETSNT